MNKFFYICAASGGLVAVFTCSLLYVLTNTIVIAFGDDFQSLVKNMNRIFRDSDMNLEELLKLKK